MQICHIIGLLPHELAERGDKRWEDRVGPAYVSPFLGQDHLTCYSFALYTTSFLSVSKDETSAPSPSELDLPRLKDDTISSPAASSLLLCSGEALAGILETLGWTSAPSYPQHVRWMLL